MKNKAWCMAWFISLVFIFVLFGCTDKETKKFIESADSASYNYITNKLSTATSAEVKAYITEMDVKILQADIMLRGAQAAQDTRAFLLEYSGVTSNGNLVTYNPVQKTDDAAKKASAELNILSGRYVQQLKTSDPKQDIIHIKAIDKYIYNLDCNVRGTSEAQTIRSNSATPVQQQTGTQAATSAMQSASSVIPITKEEKK